MTVIINSLRNSSDLSSSVVQNYTNILKTLPLYVKNVPDYLRAILRQGKTILAQCADGALLDGAMKSGFSKLDSICSKRCLMMETYIEPEFLGNVIAVVKAYDSRNGSGAFPTEQKNVIIIKLKNVSKKLY